LDYLTCAEKTNPDKASCLKAFPENFNGETSYVLMKDIKSNWLELSLKKKY
jgi:hypothetical protein